ncbi:type II toxin-antitoxin system PemK/MazF family toxin (plasmid) [Nocardia sp. NBC_01503]|uniref:type II toxin-antitoxin system PemK/MazF family toxin n=1 Tax=Nocardia sp. NBC_01503 TaxID=2975997 RepID=UPI002E7B0804|nr:type II toxin-antitoxin system PemK/MazF family toxin [Nocardia sp. NBC_01503]WTL36703.1 type II toxin-antitoxin system PemK/MazF family toxin [Nocardia sp. NBC_01503]WTL36744.1 type II toxin-antitoxin system PemK/MazF family toxin [Nocardia sp. NBC_01503]
MRRGELWTYKGLGRTRHVLVVSANELNNTGSPITCDVTDVAPTGSRVLLSIPITLPNNGGTAYIRVVRGLSGQTDVDRFDSLIGRVPDEVMEQVGLALRAALDL